MEMRIPLLILAQLDSGECPPLRIAYSDPVKVRILTAVWTSSVLFGEKMQVGVSHAVGDLFN
jgi:hypothetical protein